MSRRIEGGRIYNHCYSAAFFPPFNHRFKLASEAVAGGGGRGIRIAEDPETFEALAAQASSEALAAFGDGSLYLEKMITRARHVEVQVLGDRHDNVIHLGERDCTLQRRHQKIVEEGPATAVPADVVERMRRSAVELH